MIIYLKKAVLFSIIFSIFYLVTLPFWGAFFPTELKKSIIDVRGVGFLPQRLSEIDSTGNLDILFIGSSHAYRGFDVRIFNSHGYNSFNLGSSAQTPIQSEQLLRKYLSKLKPKLLVFEINPSSLTSDGLESTIDIICNSHLDMNTIQMAFETKSLKVINTLLYIIETNALNIDKQVQKRNNSFDDDKYIKGGYVEKKIKYNSTHKKYKSSNKDLNKKQIDAFKNIIDLAKRNNINILFVQAPINKSLYKAIRNKDLDNLLKSQNYTYFNFNKLITLDDSLHFYDSEHLNQIGVEIFNSSLIKIMNDSNIISPKEDIKH